MGTSPSLGYEVSDLRSGVFLGLCGVSSLECLHEVSVLEGLGLRV